MSFFRKLFGSDPEALTQKANALFDAGAFGEAKLAYEKARDALPKEQSERAAEVRARIDACRDHIATQRIAQAEVFRGRGDLLFAAEELRGALEVAASEDIRERAQATLDDLDRVEVQAANRKIEMPRDERIAVLAGSWEEEQANEYASYGDAFFDALLAMDDEDFATARAGFEAVMAEAESPLYLILEHAKACTLAGESATAIAGYQRFLAELPEGEGGDRRLGSHLQIGALEGAGGNHDAALDAFQAAVEDFPDDYRPYFALGQQLRIAGAPQEALEVLELALDKCPGTPDWSLLEEIGITSAELGHDQRAVAQLEAVLKRFVDRGDPYVPPRTARELARLFEVDGRMDRAADVWRMLAERGPIDDRARCHGEVGRLLGALGLDEEAKRMLKRGLAIAPDEGELRADLEAKLKALSA